MSQIQVKQIISSFCKILEYCNFTKITPEDLRIAKFNKPDALAQVWRLLFELIIFLKNDNKKKLDDELKNKLTKWESEKTLRYIKDELMKLGYFSIDFYKFDSFEDTFSSREVLIAIGWLVYTYRIIDLFIDNLNCQFDQEYYNEDSIRINEDKFKKEFENLASRIDPDKNKDLLVQVNNLRVMNGLFKSKINSIHSCLVEKAKLTYQAHSESQNRFSCTELYLMKHPEKLSKFEKILQNEIELQKNILNWIKNEKLFWTWMESVVDEKISDTQKCEKYEIEEKYDRNVLDCTFDQNLKLASLEYLKFEKNIKKCNETVQNLKTKLRSENKKDLTEEFLNYLKKFENETIENFEKIISEQHFVTPNEKNKSIFNKFEHKLVHIDKNAKSNMPSNLISINDINDLMEQEIKRLEKEFLDLKAKAIQKCDKLSSKLTDCYVVYK